MDDELSYGDIVLVLDDAGDSGERQVGSICGSRTASSDKIASDFATSVGSRIFLVELGDGSSVEVAEERVERHRSNEG